MLLSGLSPVAAATVSKTLLRNSLGFEKLSLHVNRQHSNAIHFFLKTKFLGQDSSKCKFPVGWTPENTNFFFI